MEKMILAGCIILNENGQLLLIHRQTAKRQQWETPGGKVEAGELYDCAAIREAKEEIGVDINIVKELGRKEFSEDGFTLLYIWFLAKVNEGTPHIVEVDRYDKINYFSWEELSSINETLSPNVKNLIVEYLAGRINLQ